MSSTTNPSSNFQLILNALAEYAKQTGIDVTKNPFADKIESCNSVEAISGLLQDRAKTFKEYRDGNRMLINCLSPVVQVLHTFSGIIGEALGLVSPNESIRLLWLMFCLSASRYRFHLRRQSLSASMFSSRQLVASLKATMRSLTCLNVSQISSNASISIQRSH
ncbi:hypothetical protein BJV78DRAFT_901283 [Lactifluus subvellereus]|nr:hypothetical protein BJV78DRAFT_901283 [Lactifluus subvellereus]